MFMKRRTIIVGLIILVGFVFAEEANPSMTTVDFLINEAVVSKIEVIEKDGVVFVNHLAFSQAFHSRVLPVVYSKAFSYGISDYWKQTFSLVKPGYEHAFENGVITKLEAPAFVADEKIFSPLSYLCSYFNALYAYHGDKLAVFPKTSAEIKLPEHIEEFVQELEKKGFIVTQGNMKQADPVALFAAGYTPDCNANNAKNPYVLIQIPPHPKQPFANQLPFAYRLDENEAIVILGKTPPPCEFFSYRSYLLNRVSFEEMNRIKIFASLGDTFNIGNYKTATNDSEPFKKSIMIISTANQPTENMIRNAAKSVGINNETIFTDIIPETIVNMGINPNDDEFLFLHRTTHFKDERSMQEFLKEPDYFIFRVTPKKAIDELYYPIPKLAIRGKGTTEMTYTPVMEKLQREIINQFPNYSHQILYSNLWLVEGFEAIQKWENVLGESRDALYTRTEDFILNEDDFLVVFGVNHHASGKSLYSNFSIYGSEYFNGQGGISNHQYENTALDYLPNEPLAKDFYVWFVSRTELEDFDDVLIVPTTPIPYGIPTQDKAFIGFRSYLEPGTEVGPITTELMLDRVILFSK